MMYSRSLLLIATCVAAGPTADWRNAAPDYDWAFPEDHWSHDGFKTEWWYFTGHLTDARDPQRRFGYQFTFFRVGLRPDAPTPRSSWSATDLVMGHAAITDLTTGTHVFTETLYRAVDVLGGFGRFPDPRLAWSLAPPGTDGEWTLRWTETGFHLTMRDDRRGLALDLQTHPVKPRTFQGPNGFSRKAPGDDRASMYYSYPRLATTGRLTIGGVATPVLGTSWMDKEFSSNPLDDEQTGWDWFSLQLDDGRDVMLYQLRGATAAARFGHGSVISPTGTPRYLTPDQWRIEVTDSWRSPHTDATYPAGWRLNLLDDGITVDVIPLVADQENVSRLVPNLYYWEGAVTARDRTGRVVGRGYVELTGYGEGSRPAL